MSKNNWLRARINRKAKTGRDYRLIMHTNFVFFECRVFYPYFRSFKSWKHNRINQYKN